jgi:hypothetical protein
VFSARGVLGLCRRFETVPYLYELPDRAKFHTCLVGWLKRPGDETLSSDPVDQVLDYIERLRSRTVRDVEGAIVSDITERTPFECIVVCDLSAGARKKFERSVAQNPTPDGLGYYGFSPNHKASIRVLRYSKVFKDAELRNQSFFSKLGLLPQEVRHALSAATQAAE